MSDETEGRICPTHGAYVARRIYKDRWTSCAICEREAEAERKRQADAAERKARIDSFLHHNGVTGRYRDCTLDDFKVAIPAQQKVHSGCVAFVEALPRSDGAGLFVLGPPGVGKTHLGAAMVRYSIEQHAISAEMHSARQIIRKLRSTWGNREQQRSWDGSAVTEEHVIEDLIDVGLLVIDEVGVGLGTDAERVQLFDIIDGRYAKRRPTVLLSNLSLSQLKASLGDRSFDRLREGVQVLVCDWESYRGRTAAPPGKGDERKSRDH